MRHYLFQLPIIFLSEFLPSPSSARLALPAEACAPAGAAAAPPRSPRSGVKRSFLYSTAAGAPPLRPVGGTSHSPNSRINCNYKQTGDKCGIISFNCLLYFYRNFRLPQAPRGSRFLRKPAPLRARRLRRPARRARGLNRVVESYCIIFEAF